MSVSEMTPPAGYEAVLADASALVEYCRSTAVGEFYSDLPSEEFRDCQAVLRWIPMAEISPASGDGHRRIASRERKYKAMDPATCPPIVIMFGIIQDGHHRYRVALKRGDSGMWTYDVNYIDSEA